MAQVIEYDRQFYDIIRGGCQRSAAAVVPVVLEEVGAIRTVLDVGCGEGWWAQAFHDAGVTDLASGIDSGEIPPEALAPDVSFTPMDLTTDFADDVERHHLAVCLEVAEHLPAAAADRFVENLTEVSTMILFSAAMPRQGGTGHVNCQPPAYWAEKFAALGFECLDVIRFKVWDHPDVEPWYKSNLLLFVEKEDAVADAPPPLHVIHPELWLQPR